ncbi:MAG: hypothetical protein HC882_02400 [Acidobacteria bacterium]|nr:hypothetical protein [Acidobacteriota bacterium]
MKTDLVPLGGEVQTAWAEGTLKQYSGAWRRFVSWARETGYEPMPAGEDVVSAYLAHLGVIGLGARRSPSPSRPSPTPT